MKSKSIFRLGFFNLRGSITLLVCGSAASSLLSGVVLGFFRSEAPANRSQRTLTFADRVTYQRAIEEVYWRHRIWPAANAGPKPPLEKVMSQAEIEKKVEDYLRKSQALEDYWQRPITAEQLQAEIDRMAKNTRQPEVLGELLAALGDDPFVIAECLVRPALAERLVTDWYSFDQTIHGDLKQRAEAELQTYSTVDQMKQTSWAYREIELVKTDSSNEESTGNGVNGARLNTNEWNHMVQKLAVTFNTPNIAGREFTAAGPTVTFESSSQQGFIRLADADKSADSEGTATKAYATIPTGKISSLQEYGGGYYAVAVINKSDDRLRLATVRWRKEPVESWLGRVEAQLPPAMAARSDSYMLPTISAGTAGCVDNTWAASSMNAPIGTWFHTAVWTGSEMIIWGGGNDIATFGTGGRYNPGTDTWVATSLINAPSPRTSHTAVWTGSEMIVWGGSNGSNPLNTGRRYNPSTDSWTATSTTNAPAARAAHTAVWTGTQMIVWGGSNNSGYLTTGGRYNPNTNTWTATSTTNTPAGRFDHTAVWAGTEMIVWGGWVVPYTHSLNSGGRYNPTTNTWTATSTTNAPIGRHAHTAV